MILKIILVFLKMSRIQKSSRRFMPSLKKIAVKNPEEEMSAPFVFKAPVPAKVVVEEPVVELEPEPPVQIVSLDIISFITDCTACSHWKFNFNSKKFNLDFSSCC